MQLIDWPINSYQLATVNFGHIDPECSNLLIGDNICLGHDGQDCTSTYVVKLDDTCEQISAITGVNTTTLYLNNPQINAGCTNIYVGEVRLFPFITTCLCVEDYGT